SATCHDVLSALKAPLTTLPSGLVIVTDDRVPPAALTVTGMVGVTSCVPSARLLVSRAAGAGGAALGEAVTSPEGLELSAGDVRSALVWWPDEHAPSAKTAVAAIAATDQSRRSPTSTPTSGLQFPTINRVELNCGP